MNKTSLTPIAIVYKFWRFGIFLSKIGFKTFKMSFLVNMQKSKVSVKAFQDTVSFSTCKWDYWNSHTNSQ